MEAVETCDFYAQYKIKGKFPNQWYSLQMFKLCQSYVCQKVSFSIIIDHLQDCSKKKKIICHKFDLALTWPRTEINPRTPQKQTSDTASVSNITRHSERYRIGLRSARDLRYQVNDPNVGSQLLANNFGKNNRQGIFMYHRNRRMTPHRITSFWQRSNWRLTARTRWGQLRSGRGLGHEGWVAYNSIRDLTVITPAEAGLTINTPLHTSLFVLLVC